MTKQEAWNWYLLGELSSDGLVSLEELADDHDVREHFAYLWKLHLTNAARRAPPAPEVEHATHCAFLKDLTAATSAMRMGTRLVIGPGATPLAKCSCGADDAR